MNIKESLMTRNTIRVRIAFVSTLSHLRSVVGSAVVPESGLPPLAFIGKKKKNGRKKQQTPTSGSPLWLEKSEIS